MMAAARPSPKLRAARRWLVGVGVALVLIASLLWLWATSLTRMAPGWWRSVHADDPEIRRLGEAVENDLVNRAYEVRPGEAEPWTVGLRASDANAWLNTRLGRWLSNQDDGFRWPDEVRNVQVEFADGRVHLGVEVDSRERTHVLTATFRPEVGADGALWMRAEGVSVGRLPLPADWVLRQADPELSDSIPPGLLQHPDARRLLTALRGDGPLEPNPTIDLGDGRRVRLVAIETDASTLRLTCLTEYED